MTDTLMDSTFASGETLDRFVQRRQALNAMLDASHVEIDRLLDQLALPPSVQILATLGILLKNRRDILQELVALDDLFMEELIAHLGRS